MGFLASAAKISNQSVLIYTEDVEQQHKQNQARSVFKKIILWNYL